MRRATLGPLLALALAAASCGGDEKVQGPRPPDVIVLSLDTVRADFLTFRDAETAPNLTELAKRGTIFETAIAGSSWTLPCHAQMFTGQPPIVHGVHDDTLKIDPKTPTLPELMRKRGYFAAGVWTGWYLAGAYGFERGFHHYENAMTPQPAADRELAESIERGGMEETFAGSVRDWRSHADVTSARAVATAKRLLEEVDDDDPVFLFAHFFDPHYDFVPPAPFDEKFDPEYAGSIDGRNYWRNAAIWDSRQKPYRRIGDRDLDHIRALYRGEIAWTDKAIGALLQVFRDEGRLEDALVIVVADHGEEFFEHGNRGHRQTLYDEVLRVPFLVVPPGGSPGAKGVDDQVSLSDLMPTVLDYAGIEPARSAYGRSLRPLVEGGTLPERGVVSSLGYVILDPSGKRGLKLLESYRTRQHKLVRRVRLAADGSPGEVERVEWFDLTADPTESEDGEVPDAAIAKAWRELESTLDDLRTFRRGLPTSDADDRRTDVRDVFRSELDALGYGGDEGDADEGDARWPEGALSPIEIGDLGDLGDLDETPAEDD